MIFVSLALVLLASLTGLLLARTKFIESLSLELIALGAGAMTSVALVHIYPEAIATNPHAVYAFLLGFLVVYILENASIVHPCVEDHCHFHSLSLWSFSGLIVHTLFDGVGIWAGFSSGPELGMLVTLGVLVHQIPVSLSLAGLSKRAHFDARKRKILFIFFALAAPVGALLALFALDGLSEEMLAYPLAFAGGSLLYIGASDLLPLVHKDSHKHLSLIGMFVLGMGLSVIAKFFE